MIKKSDGHKKSAGEGLHDDLFHELKLLRIMVREVAENFILRREGNIETLLACLVTLPRKKIREKVPEWLQGIRNLKLKPQKGRMKDIRAIDQLIRNLMSHMLVAPEKRVRVSRRNVKQLKSPEKPAHSQPVQ